jgi:hypothetical protein
MHSSLLVVAAVVAAASGTAAIVIVTSKNIKRETLTSNTFEPLGEPHLV